MPARSRFLTAERLMSWSRSPGRPASPAVAQDRLRRLDDGRMVLTLKSPWADGTRQLLFEPLTLLEKLAARR